MKYFLLTWLIYFAYSFTAAAQVSEFEKSQGKRTSTYFEIMSWYKYLDSASSNITMKEMGATDAGYPLHVVLVSKDGKSDPAEWHRQKKVVIFINNGIHPGEPDGIDASMMLIRDVRTGKIILPDNIALAVIPVYNIGGCLNRNSSTRVNQNGPEEYGFRGNSQNLDLNRDFTKCDSREARTFAEIFHFLSPDIFIDNHVSDGADYQHTMTLITTQYDKLGPTQGAWLKNSFEPALYKTMADKGWDLIPYTDFETSSPDKGITMFNETPRYSSGYAALFNTLSFIPETHMLKPYAERVKSTYDLMLTFIKEASVNADNLLKEKAKARELALKQEEFPLSWKVDTSEFTTIVFKGYEQEFQKSEATGLKKMFYNHNKPFTKKIKFLNTYRAANIIKKPAAYIIPRGWQSIVELLKLNGVIIKEFSADTMITAGVYHIDDYKTFARPYEKHHKNYDVKASLFMTAVKCLKGDYFVMLDQYANRYIVEMLEPAGDDSFFAWNFFDAVLQQKEGYSDYRWEDVAAEVLKNNANLKKQLEGRKLSDPKFAGDSSAILDFIYKNSPYYEKAHLRYPVYRIENP